MEETEIKFVNSESSNPNSNSDLFSFKGILMRHLERITRLSSVEFRGGYIETKRIPINGSIILQETYLPDTREQYSNAIENLSDLLFPHFDKTMKEEESLIVKQLNEIESISEENKYRNEKRKILRKLFRKICSFLYRQKYLEIGVFED